MIATDCTRDGCRMRLPACQAGGQAVTYETLQREYRCAACGGPVVIKCQEEEGAPRWWPECGRCGGMDFELAFVLEHQAAAAVEALDGLRHSPLPGRLLKALTRRVKESKGATKR